MDSGWCVVKRSVPLRRTRLVRRTPLVARRALAVKAAPKRPRVVGLPSGVTDAVLERDQHSCVHCGANLHGTRGVDWSVHHRRRRGMGGDPRPDTDLPANLVALCGSGTTGCHGWVESHRDAARALGLLVRADRMPVRVPVVTWYGWVRLDNVGGIEQVQVVDHEAVT